MTLARFSVPLCLALASCALVNVPSLNAITQSATEDGPSFEGASAEASQTCLAAAKTSESPMSIGSFANAARSLPGLPGFPDLRKTNSENVFWIDHDGGFDTDDYIAHVVAARGLGDRIKGVSTAVYKTAEKARLSAFVFRNLGINAPVSAGQGYEQRDMLGFRAFGYWGWPKSFGDLYEFQGKAFFDQANIGHKVIDAVAIDDSTTRTVTLSRYGVPTAIPVRAGVENLIRAAHESYESATGKGKLVVVALGPLTNIALAMELDPDFGKMVDRIVVQGGWKENSFKRPDGSVAKVKLLGYNTGLDLWSAKTVFSNPAARIVLVNSQTIADAGLIIDGGAEYKALAHPANPSTFAQALLNDIRIWHEKVTKAGTMSNVVFADPAAVLVAASPEVIGGLSAVRLEIFPNQDVDIRSEEGAKLYRLTQVEGALPALVPTSGRGGIFMVNSFREPRLMRLAVLDELAALAYPVSRVSSGAFNAVVHSKDMNPDQAVACLHALSK